MARLHFHSVVPLLLCISFSAISAHQHEHPSITTTMEQFSGYSIHEPHSFKPISLSVDAQGLQNQVLNFCNLGVFLGLWWLFFDILNCNLLLDWWALNIFWLACSISNQGLVYWQGCHSSQVCVIIVSIFVNFRMMIRMRSKLWIFGSTQYSLMSNR